MYKNLKFSDSVYFINMKQVLDNIYISSFIKKG